MEFLNKAKISEDAGDYLSAIEFYLQALEELQVENNAKKLQFQAGEVSHHLANLHVAIGDLENAMKYYKDATQQYLVSKEELTTIYRGIGECYSSLGICYLIQLDYKIALKQFNKAIDFFERFLKITEGSLKDDGGKYVILNNALTVLCRLNLHVRYDELKPLLHKITKLNKKYDVKGFAVDLSLFFAYLFEGVITEAYGILRQKLQNAENSPLLNSTLQTALLGNVMEIAFKYLPQSRMRIGDKEVKEKGEVILTRTIFEDMLLYGFAFANRKLPSEEYKEVIALLVGKVQKENVIISEVVPMTSGTEAEVEFKDEHYAKAALINSKAAERNEFIVGWFHTHPNINLFLSPTDIINQLGYQSLNDKAIAIVFDFTQMTQSNSGFAIFRLDEPTSAWTSYHSVQWQIKDSPKDYYSECIFFFNQFICNLNHAICKNHQISLAELAEKIDRSQALLEAIIPKLIELEYLPNTKYDPETNVISKKKE